MAFPDRGTTLSRREFMKLAAATAATSFLPGCAPLEELQLIPDQELSQDQLKLLAKEMTDSPYQSINSAGELLALGIKSPQAFKQELASEFLVPPAIKIIPPDADVMSPTGQEIIAGTIFHFSLQEENGQSTLKAVEPIILVDNQLTKASQPAQLFILAKEILNISALMQGYYDNQVSFNNNEEPYWQFLAAANSDNDAMEALLVLADGQAYHKILADYITYEVNLGPYKDFSDPDQIVLGSIQTLAAHALEDGTFLLQNSQGVTNSLYADRRWVKRIFEIFKFTPASLQPSLSSPPRINLS